MAPHSMVLQVSFQKFLLFIPIQCGWERPHSLFQGGPGLAQAKQHLPPPQDMREGVSRVMGARRRASPFSLRRVHGGVKLETTRKLITRKQKTAASERPLWAVWGWSQCHQRQTSDKERSQVPDDIIWALDQVWPCLNPITRLFSYMKKIFFSVCN